MTHNFIKKIAQVWDQKKYPPDLYGVGILHDVWCGFFHGRECDCDPEITVNKIKGAVEKYHENRS